MIVNKQKRIILSSLACLLLVVVIVIAQQDNDAEDINVVSSTTSDSPISRVVEKDESPARKLVPSDSVLPYKSSYGPLPGTLEGTIMQQALALDEEGNLRVSSDLKRIFDFFLSTIEEENLDIILKRIEEYLSYSLEEPALGQALDIMNQYVAFKKALFDFEVERSETLQQIMAQNGGDKGAMYLALLKEQLAAQKDMRSLHMSPEVHQAFYADEEAYDDYSLARMEVSANNALSEAEKQARYAEIDANAPADIVEARAEAQITDILKAKTETLKQQGASQQEIKQLRTDMLGVEAAERFETLDQERADWNKRIESYLQQRQAILENGGLSQDIKESQIHTLKEKSFDERERIRLVVYERRADAVK